MKTVGLLIAAIFAGGSASYVVNKYMNTPSDSSSVAFPTHLVSNESNASPADFTQAAEASIHAVVHIKTSTTRTGQYYDPLEEFLYGRGGGGGQQHSEGSGSGVIIGKEGFIVTNNHVIQDADNIEIVLDNKKSYKAKLIGRDPNTDLAVVKIETPTPLPTIQYGNSDQVKIGEWALAVGNPLNLTNTVTAGIISAKGRNLNHEKFKIESFIQTDAAVNPGNSGGALVNSKGELIGINTAIVSPTGSYSGYSFAIPVNIVKKIVADMLEYGVVQRAFIGVSLIDLDNDVATKLNITDVEGVYVQAAAKDSDLQAGDIILAIGNAKVNSTAEVNEQIARYRPGKAIEISIKREGAEKIVKVMLKNKFGDNDLINTNKEE